MINKFFSLFSHDIAIDLGSTNTLVYVKGKGIVIREPSVVATHKKTKSVIAIGTDAKKMIGRTPATLTTINPLKHGVISDFDATVAMISFFIQRIHDVGSFVPKLWARPKIVIGIPSAVTEVERRAVWEAALNAGAREAYLIEEPMAAAIGEGISVFQPTGAMVVDIGGGTTEIAIISLGGIVISRSLKVAGLDMDQAIFHYIRLKHGVLLGESTLEELKIRIGSAYKKSKIKNQKSKLDEQKEDEVKTEEVRGEKMAVVRGRDIETGLPKSIRVTETEVREALASVLTRIIEEIADVIESAPPDLVSDILEHGILLTGGGAYLSGIDHLIVERTKIPVVCSLDPLTSVAKGAGKILADPQLLKRVKVAGGLR